MTRYDIYSKSSASPVALGAALTDLEAVWGKRDRVSEGPSDIPRSEWGYWRAYDARVLSVGGHIRALEFYNSPEEPFELHIAGKPYYHDVDSARYLQAQGFQVFAIGPELCMRALNLFFNLRKFEGQTASLIYCTDDYARTYDQFDYRPIVL